MGHYSEPTLSYTCLVGTKYLAFGVWLPSAGGMAKGEPLGWRLGETGVEDHAASSHHPLGWTLDPWPFSRQENQGSEKEGAGRTRGDQVAPGLSSCPAPSGISHHFSSFRSPEPGL